MTSNGKRIQQVTINIEADYDADSSYLGEFSDSPDAIYIDRKHTLDCPVNATGADENDCNCDESGDYSNRVLRYFNVSGNYTGESDEDQRKYLFQDYARMRALDRGDWCFIGTYATAEVIVNGSYQTIRSGGLWGTESDSDASYIQELKDEQLAELRKTLKELGFSARAISAAFKDAKEVTK